MAPDVHGPAGSAFTVWVRDIVTFRPIRFPSDVGHTPPLGAACSSLHAGIVLPGASAARR
jgi:hypothetical protein